MGIPISQVSSFSIGSRQIGPEQPALIIGEVAQAHDGSLGFAHAFIDAIAKAGADAVKFQTHIAAAESHPSEPWRVRFSKQDESRYDYWRRMEFTVDQWLGLKQHSEEVGLIFLSSPFSVEAVDLLHKIGMQAWKIASGEISNPLLFESVLQKRQPVILSSGMSGLAEIDEAVTKIQSCHVGLAVLQCTSAYPCPPEKVGLNLIQYFRQRYECPAGLSDHSGTIFPGLSAAALGMEVLEVHVTLSREMFGPDVPASVTPSELRQMIAGIRFIETMRANPVNKDELAEEMSPMRKLFMKSLVARVDLPAGSILTEEHLAAKKPGSGIPASQLSEVVGRRLRCGIAANEFIRFDDLEE